MRGGAALALLVLGLGSGALLFYLRLGASEKQPFFASDPDASAAGQEADVHGRPVVSADSTAATAGVSRAEAKTGRIPVGSDRAHAGCASEAAALSHELVVAAGRVEGRALDPGGRPIYSFSVILYRMDDGFRGLRELTARGENGTFVLEGVPIGSFELVARSGQDQAPPTSLVVVAPDQVESADDVVVYLHPPTRVEGVVLSPEGLPVSDALVYMGSDSDRVDDAGRFRFDGLVAGAHSLRAVAPSWAPSLPREQILRPGEACDDLVVVLGDVARIQGVFRTQDGKPIPNAKVSFEVVEDAHGRRITHRSFDQQRRKSVILRGSASTDELGAFGLTTQPGKVQLEGEGFAVSSQPGKAQVGHRAAESVDAVEGAEVFVELVALDPNLLLRLRARSDEALPQGTWCEAQPVETGGREPLAAFGELDAEGRVELEVFESDSFLVTLGIAARTGGAQEPGLQEGSFSTSLAFVRRPRRVVAGVAEIELELPTAQISGTAVRENGETPTAGMLLLYRSESAPDAPEQRVDVTATLWLAADGSFAARFLPAGSYVLVDTAGRGEDELRFVIGHGQRLEGLVLGVKRD